MSRKHQKPIPKQMRKAQMRTGKKAAEIVYNNFKHSVLIMDPDLGAAGVVERIRLAMKETVDKCPHQFVHLPFLRAYKIMLDKLIVPTDEEKAEIEAEQSPGPTQESLIEACRQLGIDMPKGDEE